MTEILEKLLEKLSSGALRAWELLTGDLDYKPQESKVRIMDPRQVVYINNQLRRASRSGPDCGRY
jgi:hypothetical protein